LADSDRDVGVGLKKLKRWMKLYRDVNCELLYKSCRHSPGVSSEISYFIRLTEDPAFTAVVHTYLLYIFKTLYVTELDREKYQKTSIYTSEASFKAKY
jgi:hypothetical protein